jgi:hypothetical protein
VIRRAAARRERDELEVAEPELGFDVALRDVPPPVPELVATTLAPPVTVHELFDDGDDVVVLEPDIWETVDVVPVALAEAPFAIRAPSVRIDRADVRTMPLLETTCAAPLAQLEPPPVVRTRPAALDVMRRRPTPPGLVSQAALREHLLALFRASRCSSPSELQLVGIYDRVPGGAIGSVAVDDPDLLIRLLPGRLGRPTRLVVGRVRATDQLVTVEISA